MSAPAGLFYYSDAIYESLAQRIDHFLEHDCSFFPVPGRGGIVGPNPRYVAHYGYRYNYSSGATTEPAEPFPEVVSDLRDLIFFVHDFPESADDYQFNQCIINRYQPGQGIGAHTDRREYGEYIACYTVGGGAEMEFTREGRQPYSVYTEAGSMYLMSGAARHIWQHQMRSRRWDPGHGPRGVRCSFTFRSAPAPE